MENTGNARRPYKRLAAALGLLGAVTVGLAGCGGGGGDNTGNNGGGTPATPSLVGMWKETNITGNGQTSACPSSLLDGCGANDYFQFNSDGTFTEHFLDLSVAPPTIAIQQGTYTMSGMTLTVRVTQGGHDANNNNQLDPSETDPSFVATGAAILAFPDSTHFTVLKVAGPNNMPPAETDTYAKQ